MGKIARLPCGCLVEVEGKNIWFIEIAVNCKRHRKS